MKNDNGLDFLDLLNILSFAIGILNYGENITQGDIQTVEQNIAKHTSGVVADIHQHLTEQDKKIEEIMKILKGELSDDAI
jgi:hypothetical protein